MSPTAGRGKYRAAPRKWELEDNVSNIFLRFTPEAGARIARICRRYCAEPSDFARHAVLKETLRLERDLPGIDPMLAALAAQAGARGLNARQILADALAEKVREENGSDV